ncbi:hypothetical protein DFH28DRAFT_908266 [Melampsora americana]|nr:hypothetical protein DFH28DRAFT_908266 [Melampsora americana]
MDDQDHDSPDQQYIYPDEPPVPDSPDRPLTTLSYLCDLHGAGFSNSSSDSDNLDNVLDFQLLCQALEAMDNLLDHPIKQDGPEDIPNDDDIVAVDPADLKGWYPFTNKEQVVALLIIGTTQSLLLRLQYQRIRSILQICKVELPAWRSLHALSNHLKGKMGLQIAAQDSPTGSPFFGLTVQTIIQSVSHWNVCM